MATRRRGVTLQAVADRAGVSLKTASNAVNGTGRMSPETRERVMAVVEETGYKVNIAARNLMRGRTGAVTLAVPTLRAPYLAELAEEVVEAARAHDLVVYVTTFPDDGLRGMRDYLDQFNPNLSDGLLLSLPEQEQFAPADLEVDFPLVCLGARRTFGRTDRVSADDVVDARTAAEYLFERGVGSLAVVGARTEFAPAAIAVAVEGNAESRLRGVLEAATAAGIRLDPRLIGITGYDWTIGTGFRAAQDIIDSGVPFDGMMCLNDGLAIGAVAALRERGLRVPEDVQVVGFDNIEESAFLAPPLTTMDSRISWVARTALARLISRIDQVPQEPAHLLAQPTLIARGTTR
ncbi:LacI family DNA-binding transcriptional regulator [Agromyces seonyuensis]|uniref:LacI family DNA-binding transcriptional regulator n=1 Tax=Agromyces seonyuensis TaxID=2662446 RepID=A0A6I4P704_9MICO|nr:LacI family DNA-binding transcriptional regulator [Agromyces seonyuensis]MWB99507.1 LacI family DNA-binding transcriptional regulator [Agromyces seonyuensis]